MKNEKKTASALAALLVFCLFGVGILSVLVGSVTVYRRLTQRGRESYDSRTAAQYLATRVRQAEAGSITLEPFGEGDSLCIRQEIDGTAYLTRIYCREGWLMELFSQADAALAPEDGEKILAAGALSARLEEGLLTLEVTDAQGGIQRLCLSLRGEGKP